MIHIIFRLHFFLFFSLFPPCMNIYFVLHPPPSPIPFLMVHLNLRAEPPNLLSDAKWSSERMNSSAAERVHGPSLSFIQWRIQGRSPGDLTPPLIFRPKWGPKGRKNFLGDRPPPYLRVWMTAPPPYLKVWILALLFTTQTITIRRLCCHSSQSWQSRGRGA